MSTETITTDALVAWLGQQNWSEFAQSLAAYAARKGNLTAAQEASARSMYAKMAAKAAIKVTAPAVTETGFYLADDVVYKVVQSKTGNLYAKRRVDGAWDYAGAPGRLGITPDHKVTPEVAAAYGAATGICMFCNAELDDREGLGRVVGVGPVCSKKHLGLTQRQLADRLGIDPALAEA
jgi:hypothetical protein